MNTSLRNTGTHRYTQLKKKTWPVCLCSIYGQNGLLDCFVSRTHFSFMKNKPSPKNWFLQIIKI